VAEQRGLARAGIADQRQAGPAVAGAGDRVVERDLGAAVGEPVLVVAHAGPSAGAPAVRVDVQRHEHPIELDRDRRVAKPHDHPAAVPLEPELQPCGDWIAGRGYRLHGEFRWTATNRITARVIIDPGTSPNDTMLHHDVGHDRWRSPRPLGPGGIKRRVRPRGEAVRRGAGSPACPPGSACLDRIQHLAGVRDPALHLVERRHVSVREPRHRGDDAEPDQEPQHGRRRPPPECRR
jgi:hypothetical protein